MPPQTETGPRPEINSDPQLMLAQAEWDLNHAQLLLRVAEERVTFAKERVRSAQEYRMRSSEQLKIARELLHNVERLLQGSAELCRIGQGLLPYVDSQPASESAEPRAAQQIGSLLVDAGSLCEEADHVLVMASGHANVMAYQALGAGRHVYEQERSYKYEAGVWFNANELVSLAEDHLQLVRQHVARTQDRVKRAQQRVMRKRSRNGPAGELPSRT